MPDNLSKPYLITAEMLAAQLAELSRLKDEQGKADILLFQFLGPVAGSKGGLKALHRGCGTKLLPLCWIHEGRHYEKLCPVVGRHVDALEMFRDRFGNYDQSLQDYRALPTEDLAAKLRLEFDELFSTRTGYDALDDRIAKTQSKCDELLTVFAKPSVPLHNNASELGARVSARRRDVSLHSRSVRGARAMDIFTTIVQTSKSSAGADLPTSAIASAARSSYHPSPNPSFMRLLAVEKIPFSEPGFSRGAATRSARTPSGARLLQPPRFAPGTFPQ